MAGFLLPSQFTVSIPYYEVDNPNPHLMSEEQLKAFIAKVQGDKSLQEKLNAEGADPVAIAKAAGFSISTEVLQNSIRELSEDELEGVAGGTGVALARTLDEMFREMAKNNEGPWAPGNVFGAK